MTLRELINMLTLALSTLACRSAQPFPRMSQIHTTITTVCQPSLEWCNIMANNILEIETGCLSYPNLYLGSHLDGVCIIANLTSRHNYCNFLSVDLMLKFVYFCKISRYLCVRGVP